MATDSHAHQTLDLSRWRNVPNILIVVGAILGLIGVFVSPRQFIFSWLLAYMLFLSVGLGGWFLVLVHHLFDAGWSVPIRRINEHLACLLPAMAVFFVPIAINVLLAGPENLLYPWMALDPHADHALHAKQPLFTKPMFFVMAAFIFLVWWYFPTQLRRWSLEQDRTGSALCTYRMRRLAAGGIFLFAVTLTFAAILWMKSLQHQWFSTMYGVVYFAGSVWLTLATVYVITVALKRLGPLRTVVGEKQFYFLGSLQFAFTVFFAYVAFSQYFIIWNANMPEETFWYVLREKGTWFDLGQVIIFGHFFIPFLLLLRIDVKLKLAVMGPFCVWAWLMHFCDLSFNIMPVLHPNGFVLHWLDLACIAFIGGVLAKLFVWSFAKYPPYPQRDPRMAEALDVYVPPASAAPATPHS